MHVGVHDLERRSAQGSMFNMLRRSTDSRDTLNRRREQECSQQSATQRVRSEVNSQGIRNIP